MVSVSQDPTMFLDLLADEILQQILDYAMERDSPFYIDDPYLGVMESSRQMEPYHHSLRLESSTGDKDPLFTGVSKFVPLHSRDPQSVHRADWITITNISRRIRSLGKLSFFRAKTIAMHAALPARLERNNLNAIHRMCPTDQALILSHTCNIVIVDVQDSGPSDIIRLPRTFAAFQCLRRCTLLFGYTIKNGRADHAEWNTATFVLANPVSQEMRELLDAIGVSGLISLEEALGPRSDWPRHQHKIEKFVNPMLKVKARLLDPTKSD